jgi:hypothetical protein
MNYATDFKSIKDEVSPVEWQARLELAAWRRPYGVLEWPAMLRLLEAEQKNTDYPPYWQ